MSKYKIGDKVRLSRRKSGSYTGKYTGTEVTITNMHTETFVTVRGYDGQYFACPTSYFDCDDDYPYGNYPPPIKCFCGAHSTWGENCPDFFHHDYCPLYKPKGVKK